MLQFNPASRITAAESLEHTYFAPLRLVTVSVCFSLVFLGCLFELIILQTPAVVHEYDDSDESADETLSTWRAKIYDETLRPPIRR
jgi:hypothetical protein